MLSESVANKFYEPALTCQKSYTNLLESKKKTLMEILTMYYNDKRIKSFIGDYIVKCYKMKDSKDQSMWFSKLCLPTLQN